MSKEYDGRIFLNDKEVTMIVNALNVAAKDKLSGFCKTPFNVSDGLLIVKPETELIEKLVNYSKKLKG